MELRQYIELLRRWAWLLVLSLVLGAVGGYVISIYQQPVYQASTQVLVSHAPEQNTYNMGYYNDMQLAQTYVQLLTTQPVLSATGKMLGYPVDADQINAQLVRDTLLLKVAVEDTDPQHAADIANTIVDVLIMQNDALQSSQFAASEESLQVQLKDVEARIASLQANIATISKESLETQQTELKQQIDNIEQQIIKVQHEINSISPVRLNPREEIVLSPEQANLLKEKELRLQLLQTTLKFRQDTYFKLGTGSVSTASADIPRLEQLQSNLSLYQNIYSNLLSSYEAMRLTRLRSTPNIVQVEVALTPEYPVRPRPITNAGLGGAVGLMIAAGIAFLLEYLDDTIKTPEAAYEMLQLPVIGYIPEMEKNKDQEVDYVHIVEEPRSPVSEAFRSLRTNLEFSQVDKALRFIMVTSASPAEGKSTVAANLALTMLQDGKKVLLVDADLRRPRLHRILAVPNRVGLSDVFLNHRTIQAISRLWRETQLAVITSGPLPPNPTELLASQKMSQFLENLKELYDIVIFDSPPILVSDAAVLASQMDGVLLIINPGRTKKDAARATVEQIHRVGVKVVGAVFNRIPRNRSDYYGGHRHYSKYYTLGYKKYYGDDDDATAHPGKRPAWGNGRSPERRSRALSGLGKRRNT